MSKGIVTCNLWKRKEKASVNAEKLGKYRSGDEVEILDVVLGETENDYYQGTPTWYRLEGNIYIWSGGVSLDLNSHLFQKKLEKDSQIIKKPSLSSSSLLEVQDKSIPYFVNSSAPISYDTIKHFSTALNKWWIKDFEIEKIWKEYDTLGEGTNVLILDSGFDKAHPLVNAKQVNGWNYVDNTDEIEDKKNGHGTSVISFLNSMHPNFLGIAPNCSIFISKVKSSKIDTFFDALEAASNTDQIDIISISYDFSDDEKKRWEEKINKNQKPIIISSVGNYYDSSVYRISYPASMVNVIGVGSLAINKHPSKFGNFQSITDILAPGEQLTSVAVNDEHSFQNNLEGTSYSAPYVAGVFALMISYLKKKGGYDKKELIRVIKETASSPSSGSKKYINPYLAFKQL